MFAGDGQDITDGPRWEYHEAHRRCNFVALPTTFQRTNHERGHMKKLPIISIVAGTAAALLLAGAMVATGIASADPTSTNHSVDTVITDSTWTLVSWNDPSQVPVDTITLEIVDSPDYAAKDLRGNSGCNSYWGPADVSETGFAVRDLAMTMMYCFDTMDAEDTYITLLQTVTSWNIDNGFLVLYDGTTEVLRFVR